MAMLPFLMPDGMRANCIVNENGSGKRFDGIHRACVD